MSKSLEKTETLKFSNKYELASWLIESDISDDIACSLIIGQHKVYGFEFSNKSMLEKKGKMYVLEKENMSLKRHIEPNQETGWFTKYRECLNTANEILTKLDKKINGEQMTMF